MKLHSDITKYKFFPSVRLLMVSLVFTGTAMFMSLISTINFGWVCMVNDTEEPVNKTFGVEFFSDGGDGGTLNWGKHEQQYVFAGVFIGGFAVLSLMGTVISRFGTKLIFCVGLTLATLATALVPLAAEVHYLLVVFLRIITGIGCAPLFPMVYDSCSHWGAKHEMETMLAFGLSGIQVGGTFSFVLDGLECKLISWPYVFYIPSAVACIFLTIWILLYKNDPTESSLVSEHEKHYILLNRKINEQVQKDIPYKAVFTSMAVWSCCVCSFSAGIIGMLGTAYIPTYFKDVQHLNIASNGLLSAVPFVAELIGRCIAGPLSDKKFGFKTHTSVLKVFNTICFGGMSLSLLGLTFVTETTSPALSVLLLSSTCFSMTLNTGGYVKSPLYIAPQYSAFIAGIHSTCNYAAAIVLPYIITSMTPNGLSNEWHNVFYTCMVLEILGGVFFFVFGKGELEKWVVELEVTYHRPSCVTLVSLDDVKPDLTCPKNQPTIHNCAFVVPEYNVACPQNISQNNVVAGSIFFI